MMDRRNATVRSGIERRLLLACCRPKIGEETCLEVGRLVGGGVDWALFLRLAKSERLSSVAYKVLRSACSEAMPADVLGGLRRTYESTRYANLKLARELIRLIRLFSQNGIPAFSWKGPMLALAAYGDLGARVMGDLDIVVRKQHVPNAKQLMIKQGYKPQPLTFGQEQELFRDYYAYTFWGEVTVEIHWDFAGKGWSVRSIDEGLWDRLSRQGLLGVEVPALTRQDLFLSTCIHHGLKHSWRELRFISDVACLIQACGGEDWEGALDQAKEWGLERTVLVGAELANQLVETRLPGNIQNRLAEDPGAIRIATEIGTQLRESRGELRRNYSLLMRERKRDKLGMLWERRRWMRPNARDRKLIELPESLHFLYYIVRPYRVAKEYGLFDRTRGRRKSRSAEPVPRQNS